MTAGRPSHYNHDIATAICALLGDGWSLNRICLLDGMPCKVTVFTWIAKYPEFVEMYETARHAQAEGLADRCVDIANDTDMDVKRARLVIDTIKWFASKMNSKYSERQQIEHSGPGGGPIKAQQVTAALDPKAASVLYQEFIKR